MARPRPRRRAALVLPLTLLFSDLFIPAVTSPLPSLVARQQANQPLSTTTWTRTSLSMYMNTAEHAEQTVTVVVTGTTTVTVQAEQPQITSVTSTITPTVTGSFSAAAATANSTVSAVAAIAAAAASYFPSSPNDSTTTIQTQTSNSPIKGSTSGRGSMTDSKGMSPSTSTLATALAVVFSTLAFALAVWLVFTLRSRRKAEAENGELRGAVYGVNNVLSKGKRSNRWGLVVRVKHSLGRQVSITRRPSFLAYRPPECHRPLNPPKTSSARVQEAIASGGMPYHAWSAKIPSPSALKSEKHVYPEDFSHSRRGLGHLRGCGSGSDSSPWGSLTSEITLRCGKSPRPFRTSPPPPRNPSTSLRLGRHRSRFRRPLLHKRCRMMELLGRLRR